MKRKRGFTLIELLVVIAIIGLLSSVVMASLNSARAKARDARRKSDLHQLQLALELYYDTNRAYPAEVTSFVLNDLTGLVPNYMPKLPEDPIASRVGGDDYRYSIPTTHAGYTLMARLESANNWCSLTNGGDAYNWSNYYPKC